MAAEAAVAPELPTEVQETRAAPVPAPPVKPEKGSGTKSEKSKKDKKGKKGEAPEAPDASDGPNLAAHPRAVRSVARAKSWGGLAGFLLGGYLSLSTGTLAEAAARALVGGVVCYVAVWAGAVFIWRRLVIMEIKAREQQLIAAAQAASARPGDGANARTT